MSEITSPAELMDDFETATNSSRGMAGRADAIYHVGKLMSGDWTPEFADNIQAGIADMTDPDYDLQYHYGYLTAWNALTGLVKGDSLKTIAKNHG